MDKMKSPDKRNILIGMLCLLAVLSLTVPFFAFASLSSPTATPFSASNPTGQVVVCDTDCGFTEFITQINTVINYIIFISIPVFSIVLVYIGFQYMMSQGEGGKEKAKENLKYVVWGFILVLGAWLIIHTILNAFGSGIIGKLKSFIQ